MANRLRRMGVGPEVVVGLMVERSVEMVVGVMGILKAGGAYLPLDTQYPAERLSFMLRDCGVKVILTQERLVGVVGEYEAEVVSVDGAGGRVL